MSTNYYYHEYNRAFKRIHLIFLILILSITCFNVFENPQNISVILALTAAFLVLFVLRHFLPPKTARLWRFISPAVEVLVVLPISQFTTSMIALWLVMLIVIDVIFDYDYKYSVIFLSASYLLYIVFYFFKLPPTDFLSVVMLFIIGGLQFAIIMGVGYLAKQFYIQNDKYKQLLAQQKVQMLQLEEMAAVKERNRIAGEIHDTVGHQLTTALVQIEAAGMLLDSDVEEAKRRCGIVKDQVKTGLNELRSSVRAVSDETRYNDFESMLLAFCETLAHTTGITVHKQFVNVSGVPYAMRKPVYRACMEAITNAIRHGRCSEIWWVIAVQNGEVCFRVENNGEKPAVLVKGFGLTNMEKQIASLGGQLWVSVEARGVCVNGKITI